MTVLGGINVFADTPAEQEPDIIEIENVEHSVDYDIFYINYGHFYEYQSGWVYVCDNDEEANNWHTYLMSPDGTQKIKISEKDDCGGFQEYNGWIYYSKKSDPYNFNDKKGFICRIRPDGSENIVLRQTEIVKKFVIHNEWIYFLAGHYENDGGCDVYFEANNLYKMKTNGSSLQLIAANCSDFVVGDDGIFVTETESNGKYGDIVRYNLEGLNRTVLCESSDSAENGLYVLFTDDEYLYYENCEIYYNAKVERIRFDGTDKKIIVQHEGSIYLQNATLNNGFIYYDIEKSNNRTEFNTINRIKADGSDYSKLWTGDHGSWEVIDNYIYFNKNESIKVTDNSYIGLSNINRIDLSDNSCVNLYQEDEQKCIGYFVHEGQMYVVMRKYSWDVEPTTSTENDNRDVKSTEPATSTENNNGSINSPETGDIYPVMPIILILLSSIVLCFVLGRERKCN